MESKESLTVPTLHLNGSGFENLEEQYRQALEALKDAYDKLPVPHGRDYYVQPEGAYEAARSQFFSQKEKLGDVLDELRKIYREIQRQNYRKGA